MAEKPTVLITGAGGMIARDLVGFLCDRYRLRLSDRVPIETDYDFVQAELTDPKAIDRACAGTDAVIHLGALTWDFDVREQMIPVNVEGVWNVFDGARRAGAKRLIFASSHHTVGFHHADGTLELTEEAEPRPDTYYGVTKLYGEALARHFSDRYGIHAYCLRIGYYMSPQRIREGLTRSKEALVLSARDFAQMVGLCLEAAVPRFGIYNCVSRPRRPWLSTRKAHAELGYEPQDSVETVFPGVPEQPDLQPRDWAWLYGEDSGGAEH